MTENKPSLLVLFGGISPEHEVSCRSAAAVLRAVDKEKYRVLPMGLTKEGAWILTQASPEVIEAGAWEHDASSERAVISPDRGIHGIVAEKQGQIHVDCIFPVIHGETGEDGSIQGLFKLAGIPFVGPGISAYACAMDKGLTKAVVRGTGVRQAPHAETDRFRLAAGPLQEMQRILDVLGETYPFFVKPACTGSSVGISKVADRKELAEAIKLAASLDHKVIIEKEIRGRELEVAVLGNRDPQASPVGEIRAAAAFYDYDAKYKSSVDQTSIVEDLPEEKLDEIRHDALTVFQALGCRGMSRVDFFLTDEGEVVFNEINTLPGFTSISMYPKLWEAAGVPFTELIDRLVALAMEAAEEEER